MLGGEIAEYPATLAFDEHSSLTRKTHTIVQSPSLDVLLEALSKKPCEVNAVFLYIASSEYDDTLVRIRELELTNMPVIIIEKDHTQQADWEFGVTQLMIEEFGIVEYDLTQTNALERLPAFIQQKLQERAAVKPARE